MTLFALFLVVCFVGGFVLRGSAAARYGLLTVLSLGLVVAYYFFNRV